MEKPAQPLVTSSPQNAALDVLDPKREAAPDAANPQDVGQAAQQVVEGYARWALSQLSQEDRELIHSVTGEIITDQTEHASAFAMSLAQSRISRREESTTYPKLAPFSASAPAPARTAAEVFARPATITVEPLPVQPLAPVTAATVGAHMALGRQQLRNHDRIATFTQMRAMLGREGIGQSLDLEA